MSSDSVKATSGEGAPAELEAEFDDPADEMGAESFPASDPPSGWAGEDPRDVGVAAADDDPPA